MKNCAKCGSPQDDNAVFCNKCGTPMTNDVPIIPEQQPQFRAAPQMQDAPQFQQAPQFGAAPQMQGGYGQLPAGAPVQQAQGKSKKKLIIIICAVAAVIAITLLVLFLFVFKSKKDLIVGTWEDDKHSGSYTRFNKYGTMEFEAGNDQTKADYKIDGDNLIITRGSISINYTIEELTKDKMKISTTSGSQTDSVSFTKVDDDAVKSGMTKADLKTANSNAKLVFTSVNNKASDLVADGESVKTIKTDGAVPVESFKDSSDPLEKAVYEALCDYGDEMGYVCIYFDPNTRDAENFAQWSAKESGELIGQFPNPPKDVDTAKDINFGIMHE